MLLGMANRYGKFIETDFDKAIENCTLSLETYKQARKFVDEFKEHKKYKSDSELEKALQTQMHIACEMIELLPQKIDRLN